MPKHDNFLADAITPIQNRVSYLDGFRFGFGFFISGLLVALIVGLFSWGIVALLNLR